jgi:hypothetical protein
MVIEKMPQEEPMMTAEELEARLMGFVSLVVNMVMQQLGKIANPLTGKPERNLDIAKAWIDMLRMIQVKTKGNLSDHEKRFLDTNIAGLQMNYVDEVKRGPDAKPEPEPQAEAEKPEDGEAPKKE